jgi:hypothetical protein
VIAVTSARRRHPYRPRPKKAINARQTGRETSMKPDAAARSRSPLFMIGQDSRGNWVVQDQRGQRGGLFVSRAAALRFALSENGGRLELVVMVAGALELDLGAFSGKVDTDFPIENATTKGC